jgi:hypothetical protein
MTNRGLSRGSTSEGGGRAPGPRSKNFTQAAALAAILAGFCVHALALPQFSAADGNVQDLNNSAGSTKADPAAQRKILANAGKIPLSFEANEGQTAPGVKFLSRGDGYTLFLTGNRAVLALRSARPTPKDRNAEPGHPSASNRAPAAEDESVIAMKLVGANPTVGVTGGEELPGKSNYFIGNNPKEWRTNVPTYAKVRYENVYPGVDLVYYSNEGQLEYDFVVSPGFDPRSIRMRFTGARRAQIDGKTGDLLLRAGHDFVRFRKPVVYQRLGLPSAESRTPIVGRYKLTAPNRVSFEIQSYDRTKPLVIDPVLSYSTYLGGSTSFYGTSAYGVAVDASGNVYLTGTTYSSDFPTTPGAYSRGCASCGRGLPDAFVTKLNPTGSALLYSTYLGGGAKDYGYGIAVDSAGDAYVGGYTTSFSFPTTSGAFQERCPYALAFYYCDSGFLTELNPEGSALVYSSFLGGPRGSSVSAIAVDPAGEAFVTGSSIGSFPVTPGAFSKGGSISDTGVFVTKMNPAGSNLIYSSYLVGAAGDGIAIDSLGDPYVTGYTTDQTNFPVTPHAFQKTCSTQCAFVTELNATFSEPAYSTLLGGSNGYSSAGGIAVDSLGEAYVAGSTTSTNFPVTPGAFQTECGAVCSDAFITKFNSAGTGLVYSSYFGGDNHASLRVTYADRIAIDSAGDAYVSGNTSSFTLPVLDPIQAALGNGKCPDCDDAFVTELNPAGNALIFSTYLGGTGRDSDDGLALDPSGNIYLTGSTGSVDFPTTAGALKASCLTCGASSNAFLAKISPTDAAAVSLSPWQLNFGNVPVGSSSSQSLLLRNVGSASLDISSIATSTYFSQTNTCGSSVAGGSNCAITVTFTPGASGVTAGQLIVTDSASGSPHIVALMGTGTTAVGPSQSGVAPQQPSGY